MILKVLVAALVVFALAAPMAIAQTGHSDLSLPTGIAERPYVASASAAILGVIGYLVWFMIKPSNEQKPV